MVELSRIDSTFIYWLKNGEYIRNCYCCCVQLNEREPYWQIKNDKGTACVHMFIVQFAWLHQEKSKISVPGGFQRHFYLCLFCNKHRLGHWMVLVCVCPRWFVSSEKKTQILHTTVMQPSEKR